MSYTPPNAAVNRTTVSKTGAYTAVNGDVVVCDATSASFVVTLPAASVSMVVDVKKKDSTVNTVTVTPPSGTIDGAGTMVLTTQYQSVTVRSDGTNYFVV